MQNAPEPAGRIDSAGGLETLRDAALRPADPAQDIRGRTVRNWGGRLLGEVDDLVVDVESRAVRFLEVGRGGVLGLGRRRRLIPVEAIVRMDVDEVHVQAEGHDPGWRPRYSPALIDEERDPFDSLERDVPYWAWGFAYPFGIGVARLRGDRPSGSQPPDATGKER
jgi:sporulation protein YlmC with PRC-barrel domain